MERRQVFNPGAEEWPGVVGGSSLAARTCSDCGAFEACIFSGANVGMYEDDFRLISTVCIDEDAFV
jgi:hypothetical protein